MKRHPFDPISFVFGLTFTAMGIVFLVTDVDAQDIDPIAIALATLIFSGLLAAAVAFKWARNTAVDKEIEDEGL
ncbi:MAG TPA: hypothetical protein VNC78_12295 [Actinomycetota bacterium]|nr:hypothetical protein [Actinomycetota bacterium]